MIEGEKIKEKRTVKQYRELDMLSASDLRMFNTDRKKFYKEKIEGQKPEENYNKSLLIGSLVHLLLLEPDEFDNRYLLSTCNEPPTANMLTFTESLYKHSVASIEDGKVMADFQGLLELAYTDSGYKLPMETVVKNFKAKGEAYFNQLMEAKLQGLEVVCLDDINIATKIVRMVKEDEFVGKYFTNTDYCELKAEGFMVEGIEMKCMADKIMVNHEDETIQLVDPKIVFDNQNFYKEYYLKKQAYIQAYIYYMGLKSGKIDLGFDYSKYVVLPPIFIAVDSGCYYKPLQYRVTPEALEKAYNGFVENGREYRGVKETLEELLWAKETNNWFITKKAYDNKGIINL